MKVMLKNKSSQVFFDETDQIQEIDAEKGEKI
jgi:hypothetical protein